MEWIAAGDGSGAETMALFAAREACREGGALVVLDRVKSEGTMARSVARAARTAVL
ncbi:MAG: hypothetical protein ACLQNE_11000 [Thermoguttaceae bacterium]